MFTINFYLLFRLLLKSLFASRHTHYRLSAKRIKVLLLFVILFLFGMSTAWLGFLLDYLFFPAFRKQKIKRPIFIIGNFRSGSTLLHRLMAKDKETFCCFKTWEIYLAPSIVQRKFFKALGLIDRLLGSPLRSFIKGFEDRTFGPIRLHKIGLFEPEEEEGMLLYIWNSFFIRYIFPVKEEFAQFDFFDKLIPTTRRRRIMCFYSKCVKRLLFARGGQGILLSKNPCFSPKVMSLNETFPDARFIYLVRDPLETCMSKLSWFSVCFNFFNSCLEKYPYKYETIELMKLWYSYPVEFLKTLPKRRYLIIKYDEFVEDPQNTVKKIYEHFGLRLSPAFRKILKEDCRKARQYKSSLEVSYEKIGLSIHDIKKGFKSVRHYYEFDKKLIKH